MSFVKSSSSETIRWRDGDTSKKNPLFILVMNNIALERPYNSGNFVPDMVDSSSSGPMRRKFTAQAEYIYNNLFGLQVGQREKLLSDSPHSAKIRLWSMFVFGLTPNAATSLIGEDGTPESTILIPRRNAAVNMLKYLGIDPDILYLVSNSPTHNRAAAYGTTDDDSQGGISYTYDGGNFTHRYFHRIPGMAAMHTTSRAQTAAHEFGHAFSSYSNGFVTDLYVDGDTQFNRKNGRPIPNNFANYNGRSYKSDQPRDGLGYPGDWQSYHSELVDPTCPALMDNYWLASGGPLTVLHDKMTKAYTLDRIAAKVAR